MMNPNDRHEAESEISKMSSQSPELAKQIDELKRLDRGHFDTQMVVERKTQKIWSAGKPKLESRGRNPRATNDCRRDPHKGMNSCALELTFASVLNRFEPVHNGFLIAYVQSGFNDLHLTCFNYFCRHYDRGS